MASVKAFDIDPARLNKALKYIEKMQSAMKDIGGSGKNVGKSFDDIVRKLEKWNKEIDKSNRQLDKTEKRMRRIQNVQRLIGFLGKGFRAISSVSDKLNDLSEGTSGRKNAAIDLNTKSQFISAFESTFRNLGLDQIDRSSAQGLRQAADTGQAGDFATATGIGDVNYWKQGDGLDKFIEAMKLIDDRITKAGGYDTIGSQHIRQAASNLGLDESTLKQFSALRSEIDNDYKKNKAKFGGVNDEKWRKLEKSLFEFGDSILTISKRGLQPLIPIFEKFRRVFEKSVNTFFNKLAESNTFKDLENFLDKCGKDFFGTLFDALLNFVKNIPSILKGITSAFSKIPSILDNVEKFILKVKSLPFFGGGLTDIEKNKLDKDELYGSKKYVGLSENSKAAISKVENITKKNGREFWSKDAEKLVNTLVKAEKEAQKNGNNLTVEVINKNGAVYLRHKHNGVQVGDDIKIVEFAQATNKSK